MTQRMMQMGFEWEQIEESVTRRSYDSLMATYLILSKTKCEVNGHIIKVKPYHFS